MLASIRNLTQILEKETTSIDPDNLEESSNKIQETVIGKVFKPYAKEICQTLVQKCLTEFEDDDFVLNILEELLKLFTNFLCDENPELIGSILLVFSNLYKTKIEESGSISDSKVYKCLAVIHLICTQEKVVAALGSGLEQSIEPILATINLPKFKKFSSEVLDTVFQVCTIRKTISNEVFTFLGALIENKFFETHEEEFSLKKFKFLNIVMFYGKDVLNKYPDLVKKICDQIIGILNELNIYTVSSLVVLIENCGAILDENDFDNIYEEIYDLEDTRLFTEPVARKHLVILSGFIHQPDKTIQVFEENGGFNTVISNLIQHYAMFKHEFSSKVSFLTPILQVSNLFRCMLWP